MKTKILIILSVISIGLLGFLIWNHQNGNKYNTYDTSNALTNIKKQNQEDKITYIVTHKTGCKDCEKTSVEHEITDNLRRFKLENVSFVSIDTAKSNTKTLEYLKNQQITTTPTITAKYKGVTLFQYSGTNVIMIDNIMHGLNPYNQKKLKLKIPETSEFIDENQTHRITDAQKG